MSVGAGGVISVASNIIPDKVVAMVNHFASGNLTEALSMHQKYYHLFKTLFIETNPVPVKEALHMMGAIESEMRLPLVPLADDNRQKLRSVLSSHGLV